MRFRYPLQKIVDLKSSEKTMAEWAYVAAIGQLSREEDALRGLVAERESVEAQLTQAASVRVTLAELASIQHYLDVLEERIRNQRLNVEAAEALVRTKRSGLVEKSKDKNVWLNAREKSFELFKQELLRTQQNELDEMATIRFATAHV